MELARAAQPPLGPCIDQILHRSIGFAPAVNCVARASVAPPREAIASSHSLKLRTECGMCPRNAERRAVIEDRTRPLSRSLVAPLVALRPDRRTEMRRTARSEVPEDYRYHIADDDHPHSRRSMRERRQ